MRVIIGIIGLVIAAVFWSNRLRNAGLMTPDFAAAVVISGEGGLRQ